jgi:hypothetical protein
VARNFENLHTILIEKAKLKWSAQENPGHLLDMEPLWLRRVSDHAAASDQLTVAGLKNRKTDEANHNARPLEQIPGWLVAEAANRRTCRYSPANLDSRPLAFHADAPIYIPVAKTRIPAAPVTCERIRGNSI